MRSALLNARDSAGLNLGAGETPKPLLDGVTNFERRRYSLAKLIRFLGGDKEVDAGLELEMSQHIADRLQSQPMGVYVPTSLRASGNDTKTGAAGGFAVQTDVADIIELFRNRSRLLQMGATFLQGLSSNVSFPIELTGTTGSWVSQNPGSDVADVDATFGQKTMSPKTYQCSTSFSRQLLQQSNIENFVRADIARAHAAAVDAAGIAGTGASNQPLGILNTAGIGDVAIGANGGAPTFGSLADLEQKVGDANADAGTLAFLTNPVMRGKLRRTAEFVTFGEPAWPQSNTPLGYPGFASRNVPQTLTKGSSTDCSAIVFGDWTQLVIGEWGVLDVLVDGMTKKKQGMIEVTSFQLVDILIRQAGAFAAIRDARNI